MAGQKTHFCDLRTNAVLAPVVYFAPVVQLAPVVLLYSSGGQHLSLSCLLPLTNFEEAHENVALLLSVTNDLKT